MIFTGGTAIGLGALKILKLLKAGKITAAMAKSLMGKKAVAGLGSTIPRAAMKNTGRQAVGAAGRRMASIPKAIGNRSGYTGREFAENAIPDLLFSGFYALQGEGDLVDKGLGALAQTAGGVGASTALRGLVNAKHFRNAEGIGRAIPLAAEYGGQVLGGNVGYMGGEHLQKAKSYIAGDGYLSPMDKLFLEQDKAIQDEMMLAYEAGKQAGIRGGYYYDPYTGDVPLGGGYGY